MAEQRIFEVTKLKINSFMELIEYDWASVTSRSTHSPILNDVVDYLATLDASALTRVPDKIKSRMYFEAFDHLASTLKVFEINSEHDNIRHSEILNNSIISYIGKRRPISRSLCDEIAGHYVFRFLQLFRLIHRTKTGMAKLTKLVTYCKNQECYEDMLIASMRQKRLFKSDQDMEGSKLATLLSYLKS
jgi:Exocyst complex subunit Sec15-like